MIFSSAPPPEALLELLIDTNTSSKHYPTFNNSTHFVQTAPTNSLELNFCSSLSRYASYEERAYI